jgi:plasmid stabilization system protein ParE
MALEIHWSKRADQKFDKIIQYLENEWGEKVTTTFVNKVYDFLDNLSMLPNLGTIENKQHNIRGFTISKQVNIFYKVKSDQIIILDFFDNRQSPKRKRF